MLRLTADVGGTFTDLVLHNQSTGQMFTDKVTTTPDSTQAIRLGVERITKQAQVNASDVDLFIHGFTIATNAWLTRSGAQVALVVTEGFRDVLEIGSGRRPQTYSLTARKPEPLTTRANVFELSERIDAFGSVVQPLDQSELERLSGQIRDSGAQAVAVSLLFSCLNSEHESAVGQWLSAQLPDIPIYLSHQINPQLEEYPRANTTVAAAYVGPKVSAYTDNLTKDLSAAGLRSPVLLMRSDGGVTAAASAHENPANMLLSGPAGGVVAGKEIGALLGKENLITFDMGGTSADFAMIRGGQISTERDREVDGLPLRVPMLEIKTISAGGGSVGWVDPAGALHVGPQSVGSVPGPACYGRGGTLASLTDAAVVAGLIDPGNFAGGDFTLDAQRAHDAVLTTVAEPLGLSVAQAALAMIAMANTNMSETIRGISVERGHDIRDFSLVSFGGAGSLFAPFLMRDLGMKEIIVPQHPGVLAAQGLLFTDVRRHAQRLFAKRLDEIEPTDLQQAFSPLRDALAGQLSGEGFSGNDQHFETSADMRCCGQYHELNIPLELSSIKSAEDLLQVAAQFHEEHERYYGFTHAESPVEFVNLHIEGIGRLDKPEFAQATSAQAGAKPVSTRKITTKLGQEAVAADILSRNGLKPGDRLLGPAIVEQSDTTILVLENQQAQVSEQGFLMISELNR